MMTDEQRKFLKNRINSLKAKQLRPTSGLHVQSGIQKTIDGMYKQLKEDVWNPYKRNEQ